MIHILGLDAFTPRYALLTGVSLLLLIFATIGIYWPGLHGPFLLDDFNHLEGLNYHGGITDWESVKHFVFSQTSGPTGRPVSMLSFLLNDQFWPSSPSTFKHTNLMIHIMCGLLIVLISHRWARLLGLDESTATMTSILLGSLWLLHPFNVSTTLYVIQRMTQLMTLFSLVAVYLYTCGREILVQQPLKGYGLMTAGLVPFGILAVLSKENGVLLVFFLAALELTLLQRLPKHQYTKYWHFVFLAAPIIIILCYFIYTWNNYLAGYAARNFTLSERVLTESRIVVSYLIQIIIPHNAGSGIFHDDITLSTGIFTPLTTFLSLCVIVALLITAILKRKQHPVFSFAVFWFFCGHLLESTFIPLELYFEHRNYLPMLGPLFAIIYYLYIAYVNTKSIRAKMILRIVPIVYVFLFAILTQQSTYVWGDTKTLFGIWAHENPNSIRAQVLYAHQLVAYGETEKGLDILLKAYESAENNLDLPLRIIEIACEHEIETRLKLTGIIKNPTAAYVTGGLEITIKKLIKQAISNRCQRVTINELDNFLHSLEILPVIKARTNILANIYFSHVNLKIVRRQFEPAMQLLDKAFELQPTVDIAIRQTELLISAGLYDVASEKLTNAFRADEKRKLFSPSREKELHLLKQYILSQQGQRQ